MAYTYDGFNHTVNAPADDWVAVTPSDGTPLANIPRALHNYGTAGSVTLVSVAGNSCTYYFGQGQTHSVRPKFVNATGLTAGVTLNALY